MIKQLDNALWLQGHDISYVLRINEIGKPVVEYFGKKLNEQEDPKNLSPRPEPTKGRTIVYDEDKEKTLSLSDITAEYSSPFKGDIHNPSLDLSSPEGVVFDFVYESMHVGKAVPMEGYPTPRGGEEGVIVCVDKAAKVKLELHYFLYEEEDVIGRYVKLINESEQELTLNKAMSYQLCLENKDYTLESYYGNWAGEFQKEETKLGHMGYFFGSETGSSGDARNPLFLLKAKGTTLNQGEVYGFNLIYSGSHREEIQINPYNRIRVMAGISPLGFRWKLKPKESFVTPLGLLTYSDQGVNGVSQHFHSFIKGRVLPSSHMNECRPVLYNNWEGTYFKFTEAKLHRLAKEAVKLGVELFVLDDGWFGHRDDDHSSLGDYSVYKKKLPHGLGALSRYIHKQGMLFGLWFEPEAISEDSELYRAHPDWIIQDGKHVPSKGRNQFVLDLTREEVRDYVYQSLKKTWSEAKVDFIKWDYNRIITDIPNAGFTHRYILGLYEILFKLRQDFPMLWMENCASGGGRNDLGMMSFFDTCWVSDDTDSFERVSIQANMAKGYPPCCMSNHVSAKTNHQMLRKTSLGTKFAVACPGALGFELNLIDLDPRDQEEVKEQIAFYKAHRETLQMGQWRLLEEKEDGHIVVQMQSEKETLVSYTNTLQTPHPMVVSLPVQGLENDALYAYSSRKEQISFHKFGGLINQATPIHIKEEGKLVNFLARRKAMDGEKYEGEAYGSTLNQGGVKLGPEWAGTGLSEHVRILTDFGARVYLIQKKTSQD